MLNKIVLSVPVLAFAIVAGTAFAQAPEPPKSPEPQKFYKLEFVVKEVEGGKVLNSRSYSMTVVGNEPNRASIRAGTKVPVATNPNPYEKNAAQFQYIDVGVNIDGSLAREVQQDLSLFVTAEISSIPAEPAARPAAEPALAPVVRQNRWSSPVRVPLRQPTLIFSSDDLTSKRQMQLQLTATPIR